MTKKNIGTDDLVAGTFVKVTTMQAQLNMALAIIMPENLTEVVRLLLDTGADANTISKEGYPILTLAAANVRRDNCDIVEMLLKKGAKIDALDQEGSTALMYAIRNGNTESAKLLITSGADLNKTNKVKETALTIAIANKQHDIFTLLVKKGANVNIVSKNNKGKEGTLLEIESENKTNEDSIILLLENGAKIPQPTKRGKTFLMKVAAKGLTRVVEYLLEQKNIDILAKDNRGLTAVDYAKIHRQRKLAKKLEQLKIIQTASKQSI